MRFHKTMLLVASFSFATPPGLPVVGLLVGNAAADEKPVVEDKQASEVGSVTGRITLPAEIPEWFRGGPLSLDKTVVVVEGMYRGPRLERPENYSEMTKEERHAWIEEYRKTDAYEQYEKGRREAYENRPVWKYPVAADGGFKVKNLKHGRYNIIPLYPHAAARGKELAGQSWGRAFRQIVLSKERSSIDVGKMELALKNVVMPGDTAPAWNGKGYDGDDVKSSDFRGKFVILDFWATWCGPCIAEFPNLEKVYEEFQEDDLEVIGLSLDATIDLPAAFLKKRPSAYRHAYLGKMNITETTTRDFGIQSIPSIWLIGPDGRVLARDLTGEKLSKAVRAALSKR